MNYTKNEQVIVNIQLIKRQNEVEVKEKNSFTKKPFEADFFDDTQKLRKKNFVNTITEIQSSKCQLKDCVA